MAITDYKPKGSSAAEQVATYQKNNPPPPPPDAPRERVRYQQQTQVQTPQAPATPSGNVNNPNMPQTIVQPPKSPYMPGQALPQMWQYQTYNPPSLNNPYGKTQTGKGGGYKPPKKKQSGNPNNPNMPQATSQAPGAGIQHPGYNNPVYVPGVPQTPMQYQPQMELQPAVDYKGNPVLDANGNPVMMPMVPTYQPGTAQQLPTYDAQGNPVGLANINAQPAMPGGYVGEDAAQQAYLEAQFLNNQIANAGFSGNTYYDLGGGAQGFVPGAELQGDVTPPAYGGGAGEEQAGGGGGGGAALPGVPPDLPAPATDVLQQVAELVRIKPARVVDFPPVLQNILKNTGFSAEFFALLKALGFEMIFNTQGTEGFPGDVIMPYSFLNPGQFSFSQEALGILMGLSEATQTAFSGILQNMLGIEVPTAPAPPAAPAAPTEAPAAPVEPVVPEVPAA